MVSRVYEIKQEMQDSRLYQ